MASEADSEELGHMAKLRRTVDGIGVEGLDMSDQPDPVLTPATFGYSPVILTI